MYQNYLFDLYGTLVDIHTNENKRYLWEKMSELYAFQGAAYTAAELKKAYYKEVALEKENTRAKNAGFSQIDIRLEHVFARLYEKKGINAENHLVLLTAQFFRAISTKYIRLYDGAMDLLKSLKAAGKSVYLLTNAQRCFTVPELRMLSIYELFDGIVISSDEYTCKPDKAFYNIIIDRYKLKKEETIMIGNDYITDIKGSFDAGLDSLYIHSNLSPEIEGNLLSKYSVMDGGLKKTADYLLHGGYR